MSFRNSRIEESGGLSSASRIRGSSGGSEEITGKCCCRGYLVIVKYVMASRPSTAISSLWMSRAESPFLAMNGQIDLSSIVLDVQAWGHFRFVGKRLHFCSTYEQNWEKPLSMFLIRMSCVCTAVFSLEPSPWCRLMRQVSGAPYPSKICVDRKCNSMKS
jgi:hypothetical protein